MNILLASLKCLPLLVNGKVAVINEDNTYTLYNPGRYTTISDNYNPVDYSILISEKWSKCIIHSNIKEKERWLVNSQLKKSVISYRIGDKIHIHSRRGMYELVNIVGDTLHITCKKWQDEINPIHIIHKNDFMSLAGGIYNAVFK